MNDMLRVQWRKSSYSDHAGGDCVEVADMTTMVGVRDSKDSGGPNLRFSPAVWSNFTTDIKSGVHDRA